MKKFFLLLLMVLALAAAGAAILIRRVPDMVVTVLEKQLGKDVSLADLRYSFPGTLQISKLAIIESGEFKGETSFYVENVTVEINTAALLAHKIALTELTVENPQITIRKYKGKVIHALSMPMPAAGDASPDASGAGASSERAPVPFSIEKLHVRHGILKWIDYDIAREGFAVVCQNITADVQNLSLDRPDAKMTYELGADIVQVRGRKSAAVEARGWTKLDNIDTDASVSVRGLWLPYFSPYYQTVTSSVLQDGTADIQSSTHILRGQWTTNARLGLTDLAFASFEPDGKLFGFEAAPLIDILRNQAGRITLDLVIEWDMNDKSLTFKQVVRRSIEQSIKRTFLTNLQNVVGNALERIQSDPDGLKKDWKGVLEQFRKVSE